MAAAVESLRAPLRAAIDQLGLQVPEAQVDALLGYLARMQRWNATYNLTSVRDPAQMLTQHLVDCLGVIGPLRRQFGAEPLLRLLDVGSGGGLPGIVISILNPAVDVTCVDSVGKKTAFIQQVAGELRLGNLHAQHTRVEQLKAAPFQAITSRAFASLADFIELTRQHLAAGGIWVAMKGRMPTEELAHLPTDIDVFHVEQLAVPGLNAERCLVWMRLRR